MISGILIGVGLLFVTIGTVGILRFSFSFSSY
jgi:multisubunit Na+/H+ antiporter MnhG subunit